MAVATVEIAKNQVIEIAPEITVAYGAWGKEVTNEVLWNSCSEDDKNTIAATRFTARHHPLEPTPFLPNREKIGSAMVEVSTGLARQALARNGWNKAGYLYVATSAPPDEEGKWAEEIAERIGAKEVRINLLACNGGGSALFDSIKREELADERVVVVAIDALGHLADPKKITDLAIFGNGAAVWAGRPGRMKLFNGKTVIEKDEKGVIRSPRTYDLPPAKEGIDLPEWYQVRDGRETVFAYTKRGAFISLTESEEGNPFLEMDGEATGLYFKYSVTGVQMEVLREYYKNNEMPISICISHQPSGVVNRQNTRELWKQLRREGFPVTDRDNGIPWVMDQVEIGNASSATSLIAFAKLAPTLKPGQKFLFTSYGAGASVTAFTGQITG